MFHPYVRYCSQKLHTSFENPNDAWVQFDDHGEFFGYCIQHWIQLNPLKIEAIEKAFQAIVGVFNIHNFVCHLFFHICISSCVTNSTVYVELFICYFSFSTVFHLIFIWIYISSSFSILKHLTKWTFGWISYKIGSKDDRDKLLPFFKQSKSYPIKKKQVVLSKDDVFAQWNAKHNWNAVNVWEPNIYIRK